MRIGVGIGIGILAGPSRGWIPRQALNAGRSHGAAEVGPIRMTTPDNDLNSAVSDPLEAG